MTGAVPDNKSFSAQQWLNAHCSGSACLTKEALNAVTNFTLMWNLFEDVVTCGGREGMPGAFKREATKLAQCVSLQQRVHQDIQHWKERYRTKLGFDLSGLQFRCGREQCYKQHVEAVLSGKKRQPECQLLATMYITYRFRNNLFHGVDKTGKQVREIGALNSQVDNLQRACGWIAAVLDAWPKQVFP